MERMPSIFNDVLPGDAGVLLLQHLWPYRIARLARALLGEPPRRITKPHDSPGRVLRHLLQYAQPRGHSGGAAGTGVGRCAAT